MSDLVTAQQLQVALDDLEGRLRPLISQLQTPLATMAYHSALQVLPASGAFVTLQNDTELFDSLGMWSPSGLWVAARAGLYLLGASININPNVTGSRAVVLQVNGAQIAGDARPAPSSGGYGSTVAVADMILLDKGDVFQVQAGQTSGAAVSVSAGAPYSMVWALFLGGVAS